MYSGEVTYFKGTREKAINIDELSSFLEKDSAFKYAKVVHCDTPSGVLNVISKICPMLKNRGIMTVVDSVAAMGGEEIRVGGWKIDIALGASQKCILAPLGLTFLSVSGDAFKVMETRKTSIASYYCNLLVWKDYYKNRWFPYIPLISDIIGLSKAIDNILNDEDMISRHEHIGRAVRRAVKSADLKLYIKEGFLNRVTVIKLPENIDDKTLRNHMLNTYNAFIAGSFGYIEGKVIRIGHMGENARIDKFAYTLFALQGSLGHYGFTSECSIIITHYYRSIVGIIMEHLFN